MYKICLPFRPRSSHFLGLSERVISERHKIVLKCFSICKSQGALPLVVQRYMPDTVPITALASV